MRPPWTRSGSSSACCGTIMSYSDDDRSGSVRPKEMPSRTPDECASATVISLNRPSHRRVAEHGPCTAIPEKCLMANTEPLRIDRRVQALHTSGLSPPDCMSHRAYQTAVGCWGRPRASALQQEDDQADDGVEFCVASFPSPGPSANRVTLAGVPGGPETSLATRQAKAADVQRSAESWSTVRDWLTLCWSKRPNMPGSNVAP